MTLRESTRIALEAAAAADLGALQHALRDRGAALAAFDGTGADLLAAAEDGERMVAVLSGIKRSLVAESRGLARLREMLNAGSGIEAEPGIDHCG
jgi:hypothetical protein